MEAGITTVGSRVIATPFPLVCICVFLYFLFLSVWSQEEPPPSLPHTAILHKGAWEPKNKKEIKIPFNGNIAWHWANALGTQRSSTLLHSTPCSKNVLNAQKRKPWTIHNRFKNHRSSEESGPCEGWRTLGSLHRRSPRKAERSEGTRLSDRRSRTL